MSGSRYRFAPLPFREGKKIALTCCSLLLELARVGLGADLAAEAATEAKKKSGHVLAVLKKRQADRKIDQHVADQFTAGRLLACIVSRPGQSGRADGFILEGKELEFYIKKMEKKKK